MKEKNISRLTTAIAGAGLILSGAHTIKETKEYFDLAHQKRSTEYGSMREGSRQLRIAAEGLVFPDGSALILAAPKERVCFEQNGNVLYYSAPNYSNSRITESLGYLGNTSYRQSDLGIKIQEIKKDIEEAANKEYHQDPIINEFINRSSIAPCPIADQKSLAEMADQLDKKAESIKSDKDFELERKFGYKLLSAWKSQAWVALFFGLYCNRRNKRK